jgi:hypothetical protein
VAFVVSQVSLVRSAQAVSEPKKTNRIRLFFMVYRCWLLIRPGLQDKWRVLLRSFLLLRRLFEYLVVSFLSLSVSVNSDFASGKGPHVSSKCEVCVGSCVAQNSLTSSTKRITVIAQTSNARILRGKRRKNF